MEAEVLYNTILSLKATGRKFILVLTKNTIKKFLIKEIGTDTDVECIDYSDMWFAGVHVYLGKMNKIIFVDGEVWLGDA